MSMSIKESLEIIFKDDKIKTRLDLDVWCGGKGRKKLYDEVKLKSLEGGWMKSSPKSIRRCYQKMLLGYK
jgi:hypothetical protein|uniref:Uncharacterized protein n=1 Tax=viral metagenome TaxID=1070528 RepID=A0A6C0J6M9_9ZZZZ